MHFQSDFTRPEEKIVTFKKESEYTHIFQGENIVFLMKAVSKKSGKRFNYHYKYITMHFDITFNVY